MTDEAAVALVTGASRGLGAVIARRLAEDGFAVALNHRNSPDLADDVVSSITERGGTAAAFAADVTDEQEVSDLVADVEDRLGAIAVVVANATGPQPSIPAPDVAWQALLEQFEYFVKSPTLLMRAVLPGMKARGRGRFIHIGSEVVDLLPAGSAAYICAKTAQLALARTWAKELAPFGITVNTVAPGWIPVERHAEVDPSAFDEYRADVPAARMGEPADVANAVAFLCGTSADFLNGVKLTVNGGKTVD